MFVSSSFFVLILLTRSRVTADAQTGKFWQITDMHLDITYSEFGDIHNECHGNSSYNVTIGRYGNFHCDSPWLLVKDSIRAMKAIEPSPDFILWTGDNSAHMKPTELNWTKVYSNLEKITTLLLENFPTTKIIPVIGNHDAYPANDFPSKNIKQQYQGYLTKGKWEALIPPENEPTFRRGGYYGYYVTNDLIVLVINTNLYLSYNTGRSNETDPTGQFSWLRRELKKAQTNNTKVIITGHVPPGYFERMPVIPFMVSKFNDMFVNLLLNYSDIILTQIYGHTHADCFRLISSDAEKSPPKTHAFIAPSVTPWKVPLSGMDGINPSIRLYKFNYNQSYMMDYDQYFLNITKANQENSTKELDTNRTEIEDLTAIVADDSSSTLDFPFELLNESSEVNTSAESVSVNQQVSTSKAQLKWELLYTATELYGVKNLSLVSLNKIYNDIVTNDTIFKMYYKMNTAGVPSLPCEAACRLGHLCSIRYVTSETIESCFAKMVKVTNSSDDASSKQDKSDESPTLIKIYTFSSSEPDDNDIKSSTSKPDDTTESSDVSSSTVTTAPVTTPSGHHHDHHYEKEYIYGITGLAIGLFVALIVVVVLGRIRHSKIWGNFRYTRF